MEIVTGYLQSYDWGPQDGLSAWTAATGGPQAELWFGSHHHGASPLRDGEGSARTQLSILTKILAAARPLSIQIHPTDEFAAELFASQQAAGGQGLLSDPYGKAEMLIALEPFVILEGFREPTVSARAFAELGARMESVTGALADADLPRAIKLVLTMPTEDVEAMAAKLPAAFEAAGFGEHAVETLRAVVTAFPNDPGVFVAALLNSRTLAAGQAVYVEAGTVHAYVRGLGVEVMTNSDNVLRLGLTSKTVAVEAALEAVDLGAQPHVCDPQEVDGISRYVAPGAPFWVEVVRGATCEAATGHCRIVVCLEGTAAAGDCTLRVGEAVLLEASEPSIEVTADGVVAIAHHAGEVPST